MISSCPLPATPAIARISPALADNEMSFNATEKAVGFGRCKFLMTHTALALGGADCRVTSDTLRPTINSANCRLLFCLVSTVPTLRPRRKTVARLVKARISSSLCEINNTAMPFSANCRKTENSWSVSCGVSTDVGSSIISSDGFCSKHRITSTRCCWPTDRL